MIRNRARAPQAVPTTSASASSVAPPASSPEAHEPVCEGAGRPQQQADCCSRGRTTCNGRRPDRAGADVNAKDDTEQSAYLIATSEGYLDLLELTLAHGADVRSLDGFDGTGLIRAAERGHAPRRRTPASDRIAVDHVNNPGGRPARGGDPRRREPALRRHRSAAGRRRRRRDAAARAGRGRYRSSTPGPGDTPPSPTLRRGPRRPPTGGSGPLLLRAAAAGDTDGVAAGTESRSRLETRDEPRTPLLLAVPTTAIRRRSAPGALGADPDALDARHDTPWLVTGVTGSVADARSPAAGHPDLTIRNRFGGLADPGERAGPRRLRPPRRADGHRREPRQRPGLDGTARGGHLRRRSTATRRSCAILLAAGADRSIGDKKGMTALEHARSKGYREIARILQRG